MQVCYPAVWAGPRQTYEIRRTSWPPPAQMELDEPTDSALLHQASRFADLDSISDLRFLLKSLLLRTTTKCSAVRAESVLHRVLTLAVSDPELRAACLLRLSSHETQGTGGASKYQCDSQQEPDLFHTAKLQCLAGLTLHPIPFGHRNSNRAVEK